MTTQTPTYESPFRIPRLPIGEVLSRLLTPPRRPMSPRYYLGLYRYTQFLPPDRLAALQLARLRRLAWHCYRHVPAYRAPFQRTLGPGVPLRLARLSGPADLPLADPGRLRSHPEDFTAQGYDPASGSRPGLCAGLAQRTPIAPIDPAGHAHRTALEQRAEEWLRTGKRGRPSVRLRDQAIWDDQLGLLASPCLHGGMHLLAERLLVEVVDERGRVLPVGQPGQILCTDLCNFQRPLLRMPLFILGRLHCGCPCGLGLMQLRDAQMGRLS